MRHAESKTKQNLYKAPMINQIFFLLAKNSSSKASVYSVIEITLALG